jgi:hypothetical protein
MQKFWVEGLYVAKKKLKKVQKAGAANVADLEPFAQVIWASSADEALELATEALNGGQWMEGPRVGRNSEEQRMRRQGAPELPLFALPTKKKRR